MSERKIPTAEQIEVRAYELYLERDCEDGHDVADWLAAEKELTELSEQSVSGSEKSRAASVGEQPSLPSTGSRSETEAPIRSRGRSMTKWDRPWIR